MWHVITEEELNCTECSHSIPTGSQCLSQMPVDMPAGFYRRKYENFCIDCAQCNRKETKAGLHPSPCFARSLNHWYTSEEEAKDPVPCGCCGATIPKGTWTTVQKIYDWPGGGTAAGAGSVTAPPAGPATSGATMAASTAKSGAGGWHNLRRATQLKFKTMGVGGARGIRTEAMAQRLYEKNVPQTVRNAGDRAVNEFLKGKHASHVKSAANAPGRVRQPSNITFEDAKKNLARGKCNMTARELDAAKSGVRRSAINVGVRTALRSAVRGGIIGAISEALIVVPENFLHWRRGRKTGEQAVVDVAKGTAVAAGVGAGTAGVLTIASLSLGPLGVPFAIAGGGLFLFSAISRIGKAAKRDLPLYERYIFFCKGKRCKTQFAKDITSAARYMAAAV